MIRELPVLYVVVPCYNEEAVLPFTSTMFLEKITRLISDGKIGDDSRVIIRLRR